MTQLISPHGGALKNLLAESERIAWIKSASSNWPSWDLTPRCSISTKGPTPFQFRVPPRSERSDDPIV